MHDNPSPKLCECGCGHPAPLAKRSDPRRGYVKGMPHRFCQGHGGHEMRSLEERFWEKADRRGADECWEWTGSLDRHGYGRIGRGRAADGTISASRASLEIANGPIPDGLWVLHSCDNPPCVNPAHLRLGTPAENTAEMIERGRHSPPPH